MLGIMKRKRISFFVFVILCVYLMLAPGKGIAGDEFTDLPSSPSVNDCMKSISGFKERNKKYGIGRDTLTHLREVLVILKKELDVCLKKDAGIIEKCGLFDFYTEILQKSGWTEDKELAVDNIAYLGLYDRNKEALPILRGALTHNYVGVRLSAANGLFKMGYKEEACKFYMGIVSMNPDELEKMIENQPLDQDWISMLKTEKDRANRDSAFAKGRARTLANWKSAKVLLNVFGQLMKYNDPKIDESIKKAVMENTYIKSAIKELIKEDARRASPEVYKKLKSYLNEK